MHTNIFITGDTHLPIDIAKLENFEQKNHLCKDDFLIICGDFGGIWDDSEEEHQLLQSLSEEPYTILFIDGNHENFSLLYQYPIIQKFGGMVHKISDSIYHLMRGELYTVGNKTFFCLGGASSHDKQYRVPGVTWWEEELPSLPEIKHAVKTLDDVSWAVDYIITHCAPKSVQSQLASWYENDALTSFLELVKENCSYRHWFFGHYHIDEEVDEFHTAIYQKIIQL